MPKVYSTFFFINPDFCHVLIVMLENYPKVIASRDHGIIKAQRALFQAYYSADGVTQKSLVSQNDLPLYINYKHKTKMFEDILQGEYNVPVDQKSV